MLGKLYFRIGLLVGTYMWYKVTTTMLNGDIMTKVSDRGKPVNFNLEDKLIVNCLFSIPIGIVCGTLWPVTIFVRSKKYFK